LEYISFTRYKGIFSITPSIFSHKMKKCYSLGQSISNSLTVKILVEEIYIHFVMDLAIELKSYFRHLHRYIDIGKSFSGSLCYAHSTTTGKSLLLDSLYNLRRVELAEWNKAGN